MTNVAKEEAKVWWGYVHRNGLLQVMGFNRQADLEWAQQNPNIRVVLQPFDAPDREAATTYCESQLAGDLHGDKSYQEIEFKKQAV